VKFSEIEFLSQSLPRNYLVEPFFWLLF